MVVGAKGGCNEGGLGPSLASHGKKSPLTKHLDEWSEGLKFGYTLCCEAPFDAVGPYYERYD